MARSLREALLKRNPIGRELSVTLSADSWYPPVAQRGAMVSGAVAAVAGEFSGIVYRPPPGGALVTYGALGSAQVVRVGVFDPATLTLIPRAGVVVTNTGLAPIVGQAEGVSHVAALTSGLVLGNTDTQILQPIYVPPFLWFLAIGFTVNVALNGGFFVLEYLAGDEEL